VNRPILEHILCDVAAAGFTEVYINLYYRSRELIEFLEYTPVARALKITWRIEENLTGPAGALLLFEDILRTCKTVLVISGDALHAVDLNDFVERHLAAACQLSVVMKEVTNAGRYGVALVNEQHHVVSFAEKPPLAIHESKLVSCGIYCLDPALLSRFPRNAIYDFGAHLIPDMIQRREHVFCYKTEAFWCDIGDLQTLKDANLDAVSGKVILDLHEPQVRPGVWIAPDAEIAASAHLEGPLIVGSGARLADDVHVIGPAVIGPGSVLEAQAWLARSVLLPGSRLAEATMLADGLLGAFCLPQQMV
jgi:mannose-1-phosphate guanylyltransferase/phosphomannomutase